MTCLVQLHLAQFLSSLDGIMRGVNKTSSMWRVETCVQGSPVACDAFSHSSTAHFCGSYINYSWSLHAFVDFTLTQHLPKTCRPTRVHSVLEKKLENA